MGVDAGGAARMQLAQINIARMRFDHHHPDMAGFTTAIDPVNALADAAPGFVWRHVDPPGTVAWEGDPRMVVNLSVWEDLDALRAFTYGGAHLDYVRRRRRWFERLEVFLAMWWVPSGHRPTPAQGRERLDHLERFGSAPFAFTFAATWEPDGTPTPAREWPVPSRRGLI